jgi:hypothetical protein
MEDYWKDDFVPLQAANKAVLAALRADEEAPDADLYRRIISTSTIVTTPVMSSSSTTSATTSVPLFEASITKGSHLYYLADHYTAGSSSSSSSSSSSHGTSNGANGGGGGSVAAATTPTAVPLLFPPASPFAPAAAPQQAQHQQQSHQQAQQQSLVQSVPVLRLTHQQSLPMVDALKQQLSTRHLQRSLFMGFFVPVQLAWMTMDDKLYLFPIQQQQQQQQPSGSSGASSSGGSNSTTTYTCFKNSRQQPILAVALVRPKPGTSWEPETNTEQMEPSDSFIFFSLSLSSYGYLCLPS